MYPKYKKEELVLRDFLAINRTILANEITFMAYVRTSLTFLVVGISFIKFLQMKMVEIGGWIFILLGAYMFIIGLRRYLRIKKQLDQIIVE